MPASPNAKLLVSVDGGANQSGAVTATIGQTLQFSIENPTGVTKGYRWVLYDFPPDMTVPSGWSTDTDGKYYSTASSPPAVTVTHWGKIMPALYINGATRTSPDPKLRDESTGIKTVSPILGMPGISALETQQFNTRGYPVDFMRSLDQIEKAATATSVTTYGATGDGVTDDTAAIQAAIDAAGTAGGGIVYLQPGTYKTSAALTCSYDDVCVAGNGATIQCTDLNAAGIDFNGDRSGAVGLLMTVSGGAVSGLDHFEFSGGDGCYLTNCSSTSAYRAVSVDGAVTNLAIRDCSFGGSVTQAMTISHASAADILIDNCKFLNTGDDGILVLNGSRVHVEGCRFDTIADNGIELLAGSGHVVEGCSFTGITDDEVAVTGATGARVLDADVDFGGMTNPVISSGSVDFTTFNRFGRIPVVYIGTESSAATDSLVTITGGKVGDIVAIAPAGGDAIIVEHSSNNIHLDGDKNVVLTDAQDRLVFVFDGNYWVEVARNYGARSVNDQAGTAHTLLLYDCNRSDGVVSTGSSPFVLTIDQVSSTPYPVGAMVPLTQAGTGSVSVSMTGSDTLNGSTGASVVTLTGQYSSVILWHRSAGAWIAIGDYS